MKSIIIFTAAILPFSSHANVSNGAPCDDRILEPVFCTSTPISKDRHYFLNICLAIAAGFDSGNCEPAISVPDFIVFSADPIDPDFSVDPVEPDFSVDPIMLDETCTTIYEPVVCTSCPTCEDQNEFSNLCFAKVAGFDSKNCKPKSIDLGCAMINEPVVCTATPNSKDSNKFYNICEAEKAGFDSDNCTLKTGGLRGLKPTF
jgi:hypothetical protein